ncbi:hypothetical protein OHA28_19320 [Streptomyces sp. NBC_00269]|uniref:hypothetical protein n=1 Tax=Streptomyces sp. NBC_00269 TaxID=2975696 RepID=UPI002E2C8398|nr:hypothetical protein [Streptomyces sp. NBC_00269]
MTQLRRLMGSLSRESGVFGHVAAGNDASVPDLVRAVAAKAEGSWKDLAAAGAVGPDTPEEVEQALSQVSSESAVDLLTYLATENLVFPGTSRRDRAHVHRMAEKVVGLLGYRSDWYTNISDLSPRTRAWEPVTRHTFDGVVAGTGNGFTVVLLQVGED